MHYRRLGKTELQVSVIGIGTWQYGGEWGKPFESAEVSAILNRAKELGINLIDTAECYGDHTSESLIGQALVGQRKDWILATKFGHVFHGPFDRTDERTAADAIKQVDASLKALKTDYIDLLQYHSIRNDEFANEKTQKAVIQLKRDGKVRHIGNSISPNTNIEQTRVSGAAEVEVMQIVYNRIDRDAEKQVFPECQRQDLGVLARVPLASGYLSGKYKPGATFADSDVRSRHDPANRDKKLEEVEQIRQNEVPPGVDMATWALAWCLRNPVVSSVIPGCKSVSQVESNAKAVELVQRPIH